MRIYRIERKKYIDSALLGIGASRSKGFRWNGLNTKLVYTAESRALAYLEVSVHLDLSEDLPQNRYDVEIEIPDELLILELKVDDLPDDWNAMPPTFTTQFIGDDFVFANEAPVLKVPSSIVPLEFNYLINPNHTDAKKIAVMNHTLMIFDDRLRP